MKHLPVLFDRVLFSFLPPLTGFAPPRAFAACLFNGRGAVLWRTLAELEQLGASLGDRLEAFFRAVIDENLQSGVAY